MSRRLPRSSGPPRLRPPSRQLCATIICLRLLCGAAPAVVFTFVCRVRPRRRRSPPSSRASADSLPDSCLRCVRVGAWTCDAMPSHHSLRAGLQPSVPSLRCVQQCIRMHVLDAPRAFAQRGCPSSCVPRSHAHTPNAAAAVPHLSPLTRHAASTHLSCLSLAAMTTTPHSALYISHFRRIRTFLCPSFTLPATAVPPSLACPLSSSSCSHCCRPEVPQFRKSTRTTSCETLGGNTRLKTGSAQ